MNRASRLGRWAEYSVSRFLKRQGLETKTMPYGSPFDVWCNGYRIEVKAATYNIEQRHWHFNIHRHSELHEEKADYYALLLTGIFALDSYILFVPAPIGQKAYSVTLRALILGQHASQFQNIEPLRVAGSTPLPVRAHDPVRGKLGRPRTVSIDDAPSSTKMRRKLGLCWRCGRPRHGEYSVCELHMLGRPTPTTQTEGVTL